MSRPFKLDARGMRGNQHWPRLSEQDQQTIRDFLSWYYVSADDAADRFKAMARASSEPQLSLNSEAYWRNACSAISWLLSHVPNRQRYLECQLAMREGRFVPDAPGPATSSLPAETPSPSPPTAMPAKVTKVLKPRTGRSKKRSRKPTPEVSQPSSD